MKNLIYIFMFLLSFNGLAQNESLPHNSDFLEANRNVFTTSILKNGILQDAKTVHNLYTTTGASESIRNLEKSKIFMYAAPAVTAAGIWVSYKTLKGTPKQFLAPDGTVYDYKTRSIFKLIGGIGLVATGICLLEYSNDFKAKSVMLYNSNLKNRLKNHTQTSIQFGITPSYSIGLFCKL